MQMKKKINKKTCNYLAFVEHWIEVSLEILYIQELEIYGLPALCTSPVYT